jgi:serine protease Do
MVEQAPIGQRESLVVLRDGKRVTLEFVTNEMPANAGVARSGSHGHGGESSRFEKLGLQVETLTADLAEQLGVKAASGVVITNVVQGSPADMAHLSNGMVITEVNRKPVKSVDDFRKAVNERTIAKGLLLLVQTSDGSLYVVLRAET